MLVQGHACRWGVFCYSPAAITAFLKGRQKMTDEKLDNTWKPEMDAEAHESGYEGFVTFTKYGIIGLTTLMILMAIFLV